ncbi:MAG: CRTAC1 family protein [Planctomycetaceae bacterium]
MRSARLLTSRLVGLLLASLPVLLLLGGCREKEPAPPPAEAPRGGLGFAFVDVAAEMGYLMRNRTGKDGFKEFILEAMPPGLAVADFDGDGWFDMFCPNGNDISAYDPRTKSFTLLPAESAPRHALYMNQGGKRFVDRAKHAGVDSQLWAFGALAGDADNDGDPDLFVCTWGPNLLYLNRGDGTFEEVGERAGVRGDPKAWSTGACFFDYDRDGDLDIYVAQYADIYDLVQQPHLTKIGANGAISGRLCDWKGLRVYCGPVGLLPLNDVLYKNLLQETGELRFVDVTNAAGMSFAPSDASRKDSSPGPFYGFQPLSWDINDDGWPDLYVANDSQASLAWINKGDGTFREAGIEMGLAMGQTDYTPQASMGAGLGDVNGDGLQDLTVTNFSHDHNNLLICQKVGPGQYFFEEAAVKRGLRSITFTALCWGAVFFDPDGDGDLDLFYGAGHVYPEVDQFTDRDKEVTYRQQNLLILCDDAERLLFRNVTQDAGTGLQIRKCTRAVVRIDFDNDGDMDLATTELNDSPCLLRCDVDRTDAPRHWLQVRLRGSPAAKVPLDPAGAVVTVRAGGRSWSQVLCLGSSFLSSEDPRLQFGLGGNSRAESVEVLWPDGRRTEVKDVAAGQLLLVVYPP